MPTSIDDYQHDLLAAVARSPVVRSSNIWLDRRTPWSALIRGELDLLDGSKLYFRELVDTKTDVYRVMYSYHYQSGRGALIFRYDDTPHHLHLNTFPHHKHDGDEKQVVEALPPTLTVVLHEIETLCDWSEHR